MSRTLRPSPPGESAVGCVTVLSRTTVVVSPVSITSVAIRTAPITSTIRPPRTPARALDSGLFVVMPEVISARSKKPINLGARRARRNRHEAAQPVEEASARELAAQRPALTQARRGGSARVVAVRAQRAGVGL